MFDEFDEDGLAHTRYETVQNFNLTWEDIDNRGGVVASNRKLSEEYNAEFDQEKDMPRKSDSVAIKNKSLDRRVKLTDEERIEIANTYKDGGTSYSKLAVE